MSSSVRPGCRIPLHVSSRDQSTGTNPNATISDLEQLIAILQRSPIDLKSAVEIIHRNPLLAQLVSHFCKMESLSVPLFLVSVGAGPFARFLTRLQGAAPHLSAISERSMP